MSVITGMGIVSALGIGVKAQAEQLFAERDGLAYAKYLESKHADEYILGALQLSNADLAGILGITLEPAHSRGYLLSLIALGELVQDLPPQLLKSKRLAFINSGTVGGMSEIEHFYLEMMGSNMATNHYQSAESIECSDLTMQLVKELGLRGPATTISTACSSAANAMIVGDRMIKAGLVDMAICGGADALSLFTLNGFNSLKNVSKVANRPFDRDRDGLNLGEAAAFLLLESEEHAAARSATLLARLSGYSNTNEAYHPTAPKEDGSGAAYTMAKAMDNAGIVPSAVDYVNAHGTATAGNDAAEGLAIERVFGQINYSSTKSYTGHTLAAAGAVEAIYSIIMLQKAKLAPNLRWAHNIDGQHIAPVSKALPLHAKYTLSNSFAFGGSNVSLILEKP